MTSVWKQKVFQAGAGGLESARDANGAIVFRAGSGAYRFALSEM